MATRLVQYIIVRTDLRDSLCWSMGSVMAQACHASTAAIHTFAGNEDTKKYLADLDNMHKVICGIDNEVKLAQLSEKLEQEGIDFVLWREQPENILTAIALRPYQKKVVRKILSELPLFT